LSQEDSKEVDVGSKPSEAETSDDEITSNRALDESNAASDVFSASVLQKSDMLNESLPNSPASFSQLVFLICYLQTADDSADIVYTSFLLSNNLSITIIVCGFIFL